MPRAAPVRVWGRGRLALFDRVLCLKKGGFDSKPVKRVFFGCVASLVLVSIIFFGVCFARFESERRLLSWNGGRLGIER